jgi:hypothetical protein
MMTPRHATPDPAEPERTQVMRNPFLPEDEPTPEEILRLAATGTPPDPTYPGGISLADISEYRNDHPTTAQDDPETAAP